MQDSLKGTYFPSLNRIGQVLGVEPRLISEIKNVKDKATKIKLKEVSKYLKEVDKRQRINNDNLVDLLQYYSLLEELKQAK